MKEVAQKGYEKKRNEWKREEKKIRNKGEKRVKGRKQGSRETE